MEKINHEFFGLINIEKDFDIESGKTCNNGVSILWEEEYEGIPVTLWYDNAYKLTMDTLNTFAEFLKNFTKYKRISKIALKEYLEADDNYITFHKEELKLGIPTDISEFIEKMKIESIDLWVGEDFISCDFMINSAESDEILCVKFNSSLEVERVDWES